MEILNKILDFANQYIITLLVFGFVLCCKQPRRSYFALRMIPVVLIGVFLSTDFYRDALSMGGPVGEFPTWPYLIGWVFAVLSIWFCFRLDFVAALFYQSLTYVLEHMIFNLRYALRVIDLGSQNDMWLDLIIVFIRVAVAVAIYFALTKQLYRLDYLLEYKAVAVLLAVVNVAFTILLNNWFYNNGWFSEALHIVRVVLCILFVAFPFLLSAILRNKTEKQKLEQMLADGEKQRRLSEENIAEINRKCHDLKYQVRALKAMARDADVPEEYDRVVSALENDVMIYDAIAKTGYGGIDVLLTEKSLLCDSRDIVFTYMIDGKALQFMDDVDLYILLGNALDNAIEALSYVEKQYRIINMKVFSRDCMTLIFVENYCKKPPRMVNGIPQTTKGDAANHGFGIKSIISIAEKYRGEVDFSAKDERFTLNVLFPCIQPTKNL